MHRRGPSGSRFDNSRYSVAPDFGHRLSDSGKAGYTGRIRSVTPFHSIERFGHLPQPDATVCFVVSKSDFIVDDHGELISTLEEPSPPASVTTPLGFEFAQGEEKDVQKLIDWCHSGPDVARVDKVTVQEVESDEEFEGFEIRY